MADAPSNNNRFLERIRPLGSTEIYQYHDEILHEVIMGTQTAATNAWYGKTSTIASLYQGLTIRYYLPYNGTTSAATLTLTLSDDTSTGAIPVYYDGSSHVTNQYKAGSVITLTYFMAQTAPSEGITFGTDRWVADANYDSVNSNDKVKQVENTQNNNYELILSNTASTNTETSQVNKSSKFTANPSTGVLKATTFSGNATSATKVNHILKFGTKTFDGTSEQEITAADLHIIDTLSFIGTTTTDVTASPGITNPTVFIPRKVGLQPDPDKPPLDGYVTAGAGSVVIYNDNQYYWDSDALSWIQIGSGDASSYKLIQDAVAAIPDSAVTTSNTRFVSNITQDTNGNIEFVREAINTSGTWTGTAAKVANNFKIQFDTGTTENTDTYSFNGSAAKTINIKAGSNISLTKAANSITINSTYVDTKNTTGSTNTTSKIYLIGATSQASNPVTYSNSKIYGTDGQLNATSVRIAEKVRLEYDSTNSCLNFVFE